MSVPFPDPVLITILSNLPALAQYTGERVGTATDATLPALRVAKVGDAEPSTEEQATPIYRIEVWADDEWTAGTIAWIIRAAFPTFEQEVVDDAYVYARWVDLDPRPLPDPETELPRYLIDVGIRLSGVNPS